MIKNLLLLVSFWLASFAVYAQERTITGKIIATDDNTPLPGVNVLIKGTARGTTSTADGTYSIAATDSDILIFSFVGYDNQEEAVGNRSFIDVSLQPDVKSLNEVVVTALGIESQKRSLGTSITEVKAEQIESVRQTNVVNALTGKVAGVRIQSSSGMVGSSSSIFIRGFTSFTQSNQPLFVVDGIPIDNGGNGTNGSAANALQTGVSNSNRGIDLNPDDIESMSILKGPAAAILYGSRAVNGAIIITSKKGKTKSKNTVEFVSNYNIVEPNRLPKYQNNYAQGDNGFFDPTSLNSWGPKINGQTVNNYLGNQDTLRSYTNNLKNLFQKGSNFQNSINIAGGGDKSTYIVSYSNLQEKGILENNKLTRNTFKVAATNQFTSKFSAGASFTYFNTASQRSPIGNQQSNPLFRGYFLPRSYNLQGFPYQNANGSQSYYDNTTDNPYWTLRNNLYNDRVDRILAYTNLQYNFKEWLNLTYKIGTDTYTQNIKAIDAVGTQGNGFTSSQKQGGAQDENYFYQQINSYLNLKASRKIGEKIGIDVLVGNEINLNYSRDQGVVGSNASLPGFGQVSSYFTYNPFSIINKSKLVGIYGQFEANFNQYLYLTLTGRNDWSSTFAPGKRSYFYPSAALSFVFTDAIPSLKESNIISYGKIRANVAQVGRQAPVYSTDTYYPKANPANGYGPNLLYPFRNVAGYTQSTVAGNPNLGPEFTVSREVGTELRFLNNRISLDVAYFNTKSKDIIVNTPVSVGSGFASVTKNSGELKSEGLEIALGATILKTSSGLTWNLQANWSRIRNSVVKIDPLVSSIPLGGFTTPQTRLQEGQPYGIIVGNPFNRDAEGNLLINASGTAVGQPTTNSNKVSIIGNPNPDWTGGVTNTFNYKGVSLSFLIDVRRGGDVISRNIRDVRFRGVAEETGDRERTYTIPGVLRDPNNNTDGTAKALLGSDGNTITNNISITAQQYWSSIYNTQGEAIVFDASWIRLREASLSYALPKDFLQKTPFGKAEFVLTGRNLLLYAPNYPHFDPEVNSQGVSNSQGFEYNTLPQTRTYGALLRLTF